MKRIVSISIVIIMLTVLLSGCDFLNSDISERNVNFYVDGELYYTKPAIAGSPVSMPQDPNKENMIFLGWYTVFDTEYDFSSPIIFDLDLYAKFTIDAVKLTNHITEHSIKSVVTVHNHSYNKGILGIETDYVESLGSGVVIDISDGWCYVLTNSHVAVKEEGYSDNKLTVEDARGKQYTARLYKNSSVGVSAISEEYDLAVLCFKYDEDYLAEISVSTDPTVGDYIVSLGSPDGQQNAITYGTVQMYSKIKAQEGDSIANIKFDIIVHDSPIDHGSSGGPLLNTRGQLVGLNFAGYNNGLLGCAIPMSKINEFLDIYVYGR